MIIDKDSATFTIILSIVLTLVFFVSVPFHKHFDGLDTLGIIQIILAVFLAIVIYGFNYFTVRRKSKEKRERIIMAHNMLKENLDRERANLQRILNNPDGDARVAFTTRRITIRKFAQEMFPVHNNEILQIIGTFSDVIDAKLTQDLLTFTTTTTYLFSSSAEITELGFTEMNNSIVQFIKIIDVVLKNNSDNEH